MPIFSVGGGTAQKGFGPPRGLSLLELAVTICLIFVLSGAFAVYIHRTLKAAREIALRNELLNIRLAVEHYQIITGRPPESLIELTRPIQGIYAPEIANLNKRLTSVKTDSKINAYKFLEPFRLDNSGFLIDPFTQRYGYDRQQVRVYSQTKGYERW
ncbi:MAG: hypothetical protein Q8O22_01620 [Candidatus Omnitrophota bacterium]|nr:hypothetical protein [Candidatus Omnitrophota bacterium]